MLLISQKYELDFNSQSLKLLQIEPAYDKTFVLLVLQRSQSSYETILHVNLTGQIINQYTFQASVNSLSMISPYQIAVPLVQHNGLMIINLIQSKAEKITHIFNKQAIDAIELFVFPLTSLFCVSEYSVQTRDNLKLTYYSQPQRKIEIVWQQNQDKLKNLMFLDKSNNHSQIVWYVRNYKQNYEQLVLHDIVTNSLVKQSRIKKIRIKDLTFIDYQKQTLLNITKLWRVCLQQYLILLSPENAEDEQQSYNILVMNKYSNTISTLKYNLSTISAQSAVNFHFTQDFCILASRKLKMTQFYEQKINYLVYSSGQRVINNYQEKDSSTFQYFYPSYEYNTLIKLKYEDKIVVSMERIVKISQVYLHLLLAINEHFDDDLLQDTLQLLKQDGQN